MSAENGRLTIVHVSDVHATHEQPLFDRIDPVARVDALARYLVAAHVTPEAIVVTGDIAHRGHAAAYPRIAAALERLGEALDAPVLTALGNHDDPQAATALPGHAEGHESVTDVHGLRIVVLDSSTGALGHAQLERLASTLAEPAPLGTVLALHHPPVPSPLPTLSRQGLADADALLEVVSGTDVRAVLAGHFHHPLVAHARGVVVSVAPALSYHQVMSAGPERVAGHDTPMLSLVHVTSDGVSTAAIGLVEPEPIFSQPVPTLATH